MKEFLCVSGAAPLVDGCANTQPFDSPAQSNNGGRSVDGLTEVTADTTNTTDCN